MVWFLVLNLLLAIGLTFGSWLFAWLLDLTSLWLGLAFGWAWLLACLDLVFGLVWFGVWLRLSFGLVLGFLRLVFG